VLGVVTGVFAMHGLTADHELAMASMHAPTAMPAEQMQAEHASRPMQAEHATGPMQAEGAVRPAHAEHAAGALQSEHSVGPTQGHHTLVLMQAGERHGMGGACVAVLTGLLLLLALALGLRSLLAWRPVVLLAPRERLVLSERSPPWLAPSLSKLCVLRT
jgi:hypothetical protein